METKECTSIADHFDGHAEALKQFKRHHPMEDVQGHIRSNWWMPPSGIYSLRITPRATRVTTNKATINKRYHIRRSFRWPWQYYGTIPGALPNKGGLGLRHMPLVAATGRVLRQIVAMGTKKRRVFPSFFIVTLYKRDRGDAKGP